MIHNDSDLLDELTLDLEQRGCEVTIAATGFAALAKLQSAREYQAIIAGWDVAGGLGAEVYQWALKNRYHLRGQFVFLSRDPPADFGQLVGNRCLVLRPEQVSEVMRAVEAAIERARVLEAAEISIEDIEWVDTDRPTLLLVEDEPFQQMWMTRLLDDMGFAITSVDSGNDAIAYLQNNQFDVILCDWLMGNGSGADLYDWVRRERSDLAERFVFMSGSIPEDFAERAPGRPLIPKGQDSPALVHQLLAVARRSHAPADLAGAVEVDLSDLSDSD